MLAGMDGVLVSLWYFCSPVAEEDLSRAPRRPSPTCMHVTSIPPVLQSYRVVCYFPDRSPIHPAHLPGDVAWVGLQADGTQGVAYMGLSDLAHLSTEVYNEDCIVSPLP